jgi:hypothetical protein
LKRKLTEPNSNNKVYLRRLSNSSSAENTGSGSNSSNNISNNISNNGGSLGRSAGLQSRTATAGSTPLSEKPLSSLDQDSHTAHLPALVLAPFEPSPWLEFGKVLVGTKKTLALAVQNPSDNTERLILDPNCKMDEKGFNIVQLDPLHAGSGATNSTVEPIILPPGSRTEISICWTPLTAGNVRANAMLRTYTGRFMVSLRGHGDVPVCVL